MLNYLNNRELLNCPASSQADQVELLSARSTNKHTIAQTPSSTRVTYLIKLNATSDVLAAAHGNHSIGIYQANTGRLVAQCVGHVKSPWTLTFHPTDPYLLASGCLDGSLKLWDLREIADEIDSPTRAYDDPVTLGPCQSWQHFGAISSIDFHPTKQMLVAVHTFDIVFYDLMSRKPMTVWRFAKDHSRVRWVKFNKLGTALYTATANKILEKNFEKKFPEVSEKVKREKVLKHLLSDLKLLDELNFCQSCLVKILLWASCLSSTDYRTGQMDLRTSYDNLTMCLLNEKENLQTVVDLLGQFLENAETSSSNMNPSSVIVLEELNQDFKRIEEMDDNERFYLWAHRQLMRFSLCRCCLDKIWNYVNSFIHWGFEAHVNDCYGIRRTEKLSTPSTCRQNKGPDDYNQREINQIQEFLSNAHHISSITFNSYDLFAGIFSQFLPYLPVDFNFNTAIPEDSGDEDAPITDETEEEDEVDLASLDAPYKRPRLNSSYQNQPQNAFETYNFEMDEDSQESTSGHGSLFHNQISPQSILRQFQSIEVPTSLPVHNGPRLVDINLNHYQDLLRNSPVSESLERFHKLSDGYRKLQETLSPARKELLKPFDERLSVSESSVNTPVSMINSNQRAINERLAQVMTEEHGSVAQTYSDMTYRVCRWELEYKTITQETCFQDILINHEKNTSTSDTHCHISYKSNALVIQNSRIFNDSSLRLSSCGKYLAALVTLNEKNIFEEQYLSASMDTFVAVFRTEPLDNRGKCIYGRRFGPLNSPVCLDFSPSAKHLVVGFATQCFRQKSGFMDFSNINPIGRIFKLNSRLTKGNIIERNLAEAGFILHPNMADCFISYQDDEESLALQNNLYISNLKNYFQRLVTHPMDLSINSIVWKPDGGLVYGTTKGLVLLVGDSSAAGSICLNTLKESCLDRVVSLDSVEKNSNLIFREDPANEKTKKRPEISTHESFFNNFATVIRQEADMITS